MFDIRLDDLSGPRTRALLALHLRAMGEAPPPGHVFALNPSSLAAPGITVWSAWEGEVLLGIAALNDLGDGAGELKSMRTDSGHPRRGVAAALLEHVVAEAHRRGYRRLSLETGSGAAFEPALALYRQRGFVDGEAFAGYERSDFNLFLHLTL